MSCLPQRCAGIEIVTMHSSVREVCDQDPEQAFDFILLQQPPSICSKKIQSPQLIPSAM